MLEYQINNTGWVVPDVFTFPGGEEHVRLVSRPLVAPGYVSPTVKIKAKLTNSSWVMRLLLLKDALERKYTRPEFELILDYVPYARQDRVCNSGEALSIKVFAELINSMGFSEVRILDPHSDVTPALINNSYVLEQHTLVQHAVNLKDYDAVVAPDAGAAKKCEKLGMPLVQGIKKRNTANGKLTGFDAFGDIENKDLLIVDDICDGGGTFVGLAKVLKEKGARSVHLYVSHGIFSKGRDLDYIDKIFTGDTVL